MQFFTLLFSFSQKRLPWLLLLCFIVSFEACALYFQHVLLLSPCVMCIYERVAMLGIAGGALIGMINPKRCIFRWVGLAFWGYSGIRGLALAIKHVEYQFYPSPFATCDLFPQFPSWAPLNKWMPWMFESTGNCADIVWQFLSLSMPQWLVIIFATSLIVLIFIVLSQIVDLFKSRTI